MIGTNLGNYKILEKLEARSRLEAVAIATRAGIVGSDPEVGPGKP